MESLFKQELISYLVKRNISIFSRLPKPRISVRLTPSLFYMLFVCLGIGVSQVHDIYKYSFPHTFVYIYIYILIICISYLKYGYEFIEIHA